MNLNLGCGNKKIDGFVNVDNDPSVDPDVLVDLNSGILPFDSNSVDMIVAAHVLEHIGDGFIDLMKEIYRVCKHHSEIKIIVPHSRSDSFIIDPTHVRHFLPQTFQLFDQDFNRYTIENNFSNSTFGLYLGVDFKITHLDLSINSLVKSHFETLSEKEKEFLILTHYNIVEDIKIELLVNKCEYEYE